jgi:DNA invertase Pin-like site-specific DNA recombinase
LDAARARFEMLAGDGMSATAIGQKTGHSHHTVLRHLAKPESQWRVGILMRLDMPEMEH